MTKANLRNAKVLVVEDSLDQWRITVTAMQLCLPEITTVWASTVDEALNYLKAWAPNDWEMPRLILLDLYMPNRDDGWRLLNHVKQLEKPYNQIPVIVLSSSDNPLDITGSYRQGSAAYLVKPATFDAWTQLFQQVRTYWWETVSLPSLRSSF